MKFLIVGLGSMGKRRIRNLQYLGYTDIVGVEPKEDRRKQVEDEYNIKTVSSVEDGFGYKPDAVIISTPPDAHGKYALLCAEKNIPCFIEASVVLEQDIIKASNVAEQNGAVIVPSCTMRFNWRYQKIKEIINRGWLGKVIAVQYHMGQWLPDWHPYEDITKFYVGKRETGAAREMVPFELEWMQWIFGKVDSVNCLKGKFSDLPVNIDDLYALNVHFSNGCFGNILIDVIARYPTRMLEIMGDKGSLFMDWNAEEIRVYNIEGKCWMSFKDTESISKGSYWIKDDMYIKEMQYFIDCVFGVRKIEYALDDDINNLNLLLDAEESSMMEMVVKHE